MIQSRQRMHIVAILDKTGSALNTLIIDALAPESVGNLIMHLRERALASSDC